MKLNVVSPIANKEEYVKTLDHLQSQYEEDAEYFIISNEEMEAEGKQTGIPAKYNSAIEKVLENAQDEDWIIFVHKDVDLLSSVSFVKNALENEFSLNRAGIVCVAGTTTVPPVSHGFWWHGLGTPIFKGAGAVAHSVPDTNNKQMFMTSYGPWPVRVAAGDGLFLAVNVKTLRDNPRLRFDSDTFGAFYHFYDADFFATARMLGVQAYVIGIFVHHHSAGHSAGQQSFVLAQNKFIKKWFKKQKDYNRFEETVVDNKENNNG